MRARAPARAPRPARRAPHAMRAATASLCRSCTIPRCRGEAAALARVIAGADADAERHEAACRIAEAQIDLRRIQRVRWQLIAALQRHLRQDPFADDEKPAALIRRLAALDRYERSARMRRQRAMRAFDTIGLPPPPVRQPDLTKPISDAALRRMAGWKNPLAEFLRGYPGLLRDLSRTNPMRLAARPAWPALAAGRTAASREPRQAATLLPRPAAILRKRTQRRKASAGLVRAILPKQTQRTAHAAAPAQALKTNPTCESAMTAGNCVRGRAQRARAQTRACARRKPVRIFPGAVCAAQPCSGSKTKPTGEGAKPLPVSQPAIRSKSRARRLVLRGRHHQGEAVVGIAEIDRHEVRVLAEAQRAVHGHHRQLEVLSLNGYGTAKDYADARALVREGRRGGAFGRDVRDRNDVRTRSRRG